MVWAHDTWQGCPSTMETEIHCIISHKLCPLYMQCTYASIIFHMNSVNKEWGTIGCQQVKLGIGELPAMGTCKLPQVLLFWAWTCDNSQNKPSLHWPKMRYILKFTISYSWLFQEASRDVVDVLDSCCTRQWVWNYACPSGAGWGRLCIGQLDSYYSYPNALSYTQYSVVLPHCEHFLLLDYIIVVE